MIVEIKNLKIPVALSFGLIIIVNRVRADALNSSVAQWQSIRLLTGGL